MQNKHLYKIINKLQNTINELEKKMLNTRTLLLHIINDNINSIKDELVEARNIKKNMKQQIKNIITIEIQEQIDDKFNKLVKNQRASLSQYIRKSMLSNTDQSRLANLEKQIKLLSND